MENDKHEWKQILETVKVIGPVFHMDFSENITASPKFEPQSSHFSKRQFSLHCTVMHTAKEGIPGNTYIYHLSDDVKHDSIFTMNVVHDILNNFDLDSVQPLRFKSDNCSSQYKSRYVFHAWKKLAESVQKTVIVYYGVKGHGKGLVDAMSGFGFKTPLKRAIINEDFFFNKSEHLNRYLQEINLSENRKYYHLYPMTRDTQRQELKIKDCQKQHMMAFFYDGSIQIKENLCSCNACLLGNFVQCKVEKGIIVTRYVDYDSVSDEFDSDYDISDEFNESDDSSDVDKLQPDIIFDIITPGSTIALYSPPNAGELF